MTLDSSALDTTDGWNFLRAKDAFADDTDYVGTVAAPPDDDTIDVQALRLNPDQATARIYFMVVPVNGAAGAGVPVARGAITFDAQLIEVIQPKTIMEPNESAQQQYFIDTEAVTGVAFNRKAFVESESGRYYLRLSNFSGTPAGAGSMRIYYRLG